MVCIHTYWIYGICWDTDTFTQSLTPKSVSTAQLRCGRQEDWDAVRARRRWRCLPGSLLMGELTFTLGGCGLWLLLLQKWFNLPYGIWGNLFWWMKTGTLKHLEMSGGLVYIQYLNLLTHSIWHDCDYNYWGLMLTVSLDSTWYRRTDNKCNSMSVASPSDVIHQIVVTSKQVHNSSRKPAFFGKSHIFMAALYVADGKWKTLHPKMSLNSAHCINSSEFLNVVQIFHKKTKSLLEDSARIRFREALKTAIATSMLLCHTAVFFFALCVVNLRTKEAKRTVKRCTLFCAMSNAKLCCPPCSLAPCCLSFVSLCFFLPAVNQSIDLYLYSAKS